MTDSSTLMDLMKEVENKTGVPINGQKIIFNGKSMTSLDHEKNLSDLRFKDGCKVMILGKKIDPQSDELYREILAVQEKIFALANKFAEIEKELRDIENGHLERRLQPEALKNLSKRCKVCCEEYMRILEKLDSFTFEEHQAAAKQKRKSVVNEANAGHDRAEELSQKIDSLLD